jgi:hypothetical protein
LAIAGEQGSAKTVLSKLLRALIDPSVAPVRALPRDERELFIAASNGHVLAFDNLSGLPPWLSDSGSGHQYQLPYRVHFLDNRWSWALGQSCNAFFGQVAPPWTNYYQSGAMLVRCRSRELWSMSAIVSFTEATTNPYASSVRLISEPHSGQASFLASAIFRNVK